MGYSRYSLTEVVAILLCVLSPLWWSELGTSFFNSWTSPLLLWGLYVLLKTTASSQPLRKYIILSGMLFGFTVGLKLTNAIFCVALFIALIFMVHDRGWSRIVRFSGFLILGGVLGFGLTAWWNWYLWREWGSPVFPLYNAIFKSPYFDFVNYRDMRFYFSSLQDFLSFIIDSAFLTNKTAEVYFADARLLVVFLLIPVSIFCRRAVKFHKQTVALIAFMASSFTLWALMLSIYDSS